MKNYVLIGVLLLVITLIAAIVLIPTGTTSQITSLDSQTFSKNIASGDYTLLDIRTIDEFNLGHLKGAKEIDYYQTKAFSDYLDSLDKTKKYLIYCRTGRRSGLALEIFKQKGFKYVSDLAGGYNTWTTAALPIEK